MEGTSEGTGEEKEHEDCLQHTTSSRLPSTFTAAMAYLPFTAKQHLTNDLCSTEINCALEVHQIQPFHF